MLQPDNTIAVRPAELEEVAQAIEVSRLAFNSVRNVYHAKPEVIADQIEREQEGTRLIALIDDTIIGTAQFESHTKHIHIISLGVHPDFRCRGVARTLIEWIADHAPSLGHDTVKLDAIKETGNVTIYKKLGFHEVSESVADWCESDRYDELHNVTMERRVS